MIRNVEKLKGKNDDFCQAKLDHHKELSKEVKRFREEGKIAFKRKDNTG